MSFPSSPTNGQQATVNGITYTYSTATTSWNVSTAYANDFVTLSATGTITAGNVATAGTVSASGNVSGSYILGNGSQLTGLTATYGNANVATFMAAFGSNTISTTGNITVGYILGNGSQLTGLPATYGNANVAANLASFANNPVSTTGNITAGYFIGNGSQLTGVGSSQWTTSGSNIYYTTGGVSIGTTANSAKLDVGGFSSSGLNNIGLALSDGPGSANAGLQIVFRNPATTYTYASVGYSNEAGASAGALLFYTNPSIFADTNTERMRIDSSGAVGIGTTTPSSFGKFGVRGAVNLATWGNTSGHFSDAVTGSLYITHSSNKVSLKTDSDLELFCNNAGDSIIFSTNATERLRIPSDSAGITFPATQSASSNANTLDDYEEGTWTPATPGGGYVFSTVSGKYTKIGNVVYIGFTVRFSTVGANASAVVFGGLPFAAATPGTSAAREGTSTGAMYMVASSSTTNVELNSQDGVSGTRTIRVNEDYICSYFYYV